MSEAKCFFDTNVLLYLLSSDVEKANRAESLLAGESVVSVQVLNELVSVATRKLGMPWQEIHDILKILRSVCDVQPLGLDTHELAVALSERYRFAIYDAMILSSAQLAGCEVVFTEDLQHQQVINERLTVINPFLE